MKHIYIKKLGFFPYTSIFLGLFLLGIIPGKAQTLSTPQVSSEDERLLSLANQYFPANLDSALIISQNLLSKTQPPLFKAKVNYLLGEVLFQRGAYAKAISNYFIALHNFEAESNYTGQAKTYNALGILHYYIIQPQNALKYHNLALEICKKHQLELQEAQTLGHLGHFYEKEEDYEKALIYQEQAFEIYQRINSDEGLSTIYGNLGSIYEDLDNYDRAFEYFSKGLAHNLKTDQVFERIVHLNNLGDIYRKRGHFENALIKTKEALNLAIQLDQKHQIHSALKDLAKTYMEQGEYLPAYQHLSEAMELHTEIYQEESLRQIANMQALHDIHEQEKEIALLQREQRLNDIISNGLVVIIILLVVVVWLVFHQQRLKIKRNKELHNAQQEMIRMELDHSNLSRQKLQNELEANAQQLTNHALHIIQKNKMLREIKTKLTHLKQNYKPLDKPIGRMISKIDDSFNFDEEWADFQENFEQVHPEFYQSLNQKFPQLTSGDIKLCALLKLNLDSKDISTILGISQDSLRVNRYRLRKKLDLDRGTNLVTYVMNI